MEDEKVDINKLHVLIREVQNQNWKAYVKFVGSGDMLQLNKDLDEVVRKICDFPDKEIAKGVKAANDYWITGWAILCNKIKEDM